MPTMSITVGEKVGELVAGFWRIKWWKYKYLVAAVLVINLILINQFFHFDLNPFRSSPDHLNVANPPPGPDRGAEFVPAMPEHHDHQQPGVPPPGPPETKPSGITTPTIQDPPVTSGQASHSSHTSTTSVTVISYKPAPPLPTPTVVGALDLNGYEFDGAYIGWPLQRLCSETQWVPGLVFVCDNNSGGIGNVRNFILSCIRYAIDGGAAELIMPRIQRRAEDDLANLFTGGFHEFEYFFDREHFMYAMGTYCPQMRIRNTLQDVPYSQNMIKMEEFYPKDLNMDLDGCDGRGLNRHLDMFRSKFHKWLGDNKHKPSVEIPVSIRFKWAVFFEWPIFRDGAEFANTFGDLLRLRKDVKNLATTVLKEMHGFIKANSTIDTDVTYLGVHLRTESDALGFWPSFDVQSDGYLAEAKSRSVKHAFLACGDPVEAKRFSDKVATQSGVKVTTKLQLLKGKDLEALNALSWDQQALVDFLVLEKSTHFTGCSFSSFSMNIAMKRHLMTEGIASRQWKSPGDQYSTLIGRFESWYGDWMFMYECMWP